MNALFDQDAMRRRIERELVDGYDEEIEMEMEVPVLQKQLPGWYIQSVD